MGIYAKVKMKHERTITHIVALMIKISFVTHQKLFIRH